MIMCKVLKKYIHRSTILKVRAFNTYLKNILSHIGVNKRMVIESANIKKIKVIEVPKKHVFCGYFDLQPNNLEDTSKILVHLLKKNAKSGIDSIDLGLADIRTGNIELIAKSKAWSWQMGSRLRWSIEKNVIYYNDVDKNGYCCKKMDINRGICLKKIPYALYDISPDETYGLTINFDRLQRLRPGYGYSNFNDETTGINIPDNDGIFIVDLRTLSKILLVSYKELSERGINIEDSEHYINHISISPDSKKVMFFHICTIKKSPGWKATLWVINIETKSLKCLEKNDQVSHYVWKDNVNLLITGINNTTKISFYRLYNVETGLFTEYNNVLKEDGHPVYSKTLNGFYSDTYPNHHCMQKLFFYDHQHGYNRLAEFFSDPRLFGEKRCDLHPHFFNNIERIAVDSTFKKRKRNIVVLDL